MTMSLPRPAGHEADGAAAADAKPVWDLPVHGEPWERPDGELVRSLNRVSSATACAKLHELGIRRSYLSGPTALELGNKVTGPARTLQFMPQREDVASGLAQEYVERSTALWAVLEEVQPGDVLVVQAYGSAFTGCLGDMLVRYFKRKGGAADRRRRAYPGRAPRPRTRRPDLVHRHHPALRLPVRAVPWAYDVPVAAGGVLTLPGDLVVADDDGAVVVPVSKAQEIVDSAFDHEQWEEFSRMRIDQGARLSDYYPLSPDSREEYEQWRASKR